MCWTFGKKINFYVGSCFILTCFILTTCLLVLNSKITCQYKTLPEFSKHLVYIWPVETIFRCNIKLYIICPSWNKEKQKTFYFN